MYMMKVADAGNNVIRPTADAEVAEVQSKDVFFWSVYYDTTSFDEK